MRMVCRYYAENAERQLADEVVETSATKSFVRFAAGCGPGGHALNFPFGSISVCCAGSNGRQRWFAEARFERAAVRPGN